MFSCYFANPLQFLKTYVDVLVKKHSNVRICGEGKGKGHAIEGDAGAPYRLLLALPVLSLALDDERVGELRDDPRLLRVALLLGPHLSIV